MLLLVLHNECRLLVKDFRLRLYFVRDVLDQLRRLGKQVLLPSPLRSLMSFGHSALISHVLKRLAAFGTEEVARSGGVKV